MTLIRIVKHKKITTTTKIVDVLFSHARVRWVFYADSDNNQQLSRLAVIIMLLLLLLLLLMLLLIVMLVHDAAAAFFFLITLLCVFLCFIFSFPIFTLYIFLVVVVGVVFGVDGALTPLK